MNGSTSKFSLTFDSRKSLEFLSRKLMDTSFKALFNHIFYFVWCSKGVVVASATTKRDILLFYLFGPAGKIIRMTNPALGVLNLSERQCQTSTV